MKVAHININTGKFKLISANQVPNSTRVISRFKKNDNNPTFNPVKILARAKTIGSFLAFPCCLILLFLLVWVVLTDSPPDFSQPSKVKNATVVTSSGSESSNVFRVFQSILEFDNLWAKASEEERSLVKTRFPFNQTLMQWLERDRSKTRQIGNTIFFTDKDTRLIIYR